VYSFAEPSPASGHCENAGAKPFSSPKPPGNCHSSSTFHLSMSPSTDSGLELPTGPGTSAP